MKKYLLFLQTTVLTGGTVFAWYTVFGDFARFFNYGGKLLQFSGCTYPNPLATPCFYGSIAFLVALSLSFLILSTKAIKLQKYLSLLLLGGSIFAWSMVAKEFYKFNHIKTGAYIGCTGLTASSPIFTPCFTGASIFFIAFVLSLFCLRLLTTGKK